MQRQFKANGDSKSVKDDNWSDDEFEEPGEQILWDGFSPAEESKGEMIAEIEEEPAGKSESSFNNLSVATRQKVVSNGNLLPYILTFLDATTFNNLWWVNHSVNETLSQYINRATKIFLLEQNQSLPKKREIKGVKGHFAAISSLLEKKIKEAFNTKDWVKFDKYVYLASRNAKLIFKNGRWQLREPILEKVYLHIFSEKDILKDITIAYTKLLSYGVLPPTNAIIILYEKNYYYFTHWFTDLNTFFKNLMKHGFDLFDMVDLIGDLTIADLAYSCKKVFLELLDLIPLPTDEKKQFYILFKTFANCVITNKVLNIDVEILTKLLLLDINLSATNEAGNTFLQQLTIENSKFLKNHNGNDFVCIFSKILNKLNQFCLSPIKLLNFINNQNCDGMSLLMLAVEKNQATLFKTLLDLKANVSLKNADGQTAFSLAVAMTHPDTRQNFVRLLASSQKKGAIGNQNLQEYVVDMLTKRFFSKYFGIHPKSDRCDNRPRPDFFISDPNHDLLKHLYIFQDKKLTVKEIKKQLSLLLNEPRAKLLWEHELRWISNDILWLIDFLNPQPKTSVRKLFDNVLTITTKAFEHKAERK